MDNMRRTEVLKRWLLSDPASVTYRHWREVTREIIEVTTVLIARGGRTRREAALFLLADELQRDIGGDSGLVLCDVGMHEKPSHTKGGDVDWWTLAEAFIEEYAGQTPKTTTGPRQPLKRAAAMKRRRHPYEETTNGGTPQ